MRPSRARRAGAASALLAAAGMLASSCGPEPLAAHPALAAPEPAAAPARGSLRCEVRLRGAAPAPPAIAIDKNVEHCGSTLHDPVLLVRAGRVQNAVVALAGRPPDGDVAPDAHGELHLESGGCVMEPRIQTATAGARLVIHNGDTIAHNPHGWLDGTRTVFNVTLLDGQVEAKKTLRQAGVYRVDCDTHSWMRAYVHVFDHPFHARTDESGSAEIRGVPAGRHELRVWHEVLGERSAAVEVLPDRETRVELEFELLDHRAPALIPPGMQPWIARVPAAEAAPTAER